jgi:hypothetical protein
MKNEYQKQADDFLEKTKTTFKAKFIKHDLYFQDDKQWRDIYRITLIRNGQRWAFRFGQSLKDSDGKTPPTPYHVFAVLQKYDVGTFENFCSDFGYDTDSRKAYKLYKAVAKEWESVNDMFSDVLDDLQEIN